MSSSSRPGVLGDLDDLVVVGRVLGLDVRVDGVLDAQGRRAAPCEARPDGGLVELVGVLLAAVDGDNVLDEHVHGVLVLLGLGEDAEGLLVEAVVDGDLGDLLDIIAVEAVDIVHHLALVGADGGEQQEVLEAAVVAERRRLEDDLFEQLDELVRQVGGHEGLDGGRDVVRVGGLGDGGGGDLLDELAAMGPRLVLEHGVVVGDGDQLIVAEALGVGDVGEVGVALLAVLADDARVVEVVFLEEGLGVVVAVDGDLGEGVVERLVLGAGLDLGLEEGEDELEAVALLDPSTSSSTGMGPAADDLRGARRVDALHVDLDEVDEHVLVEVEDEVVDKVEAVADDDERQLVRELCLLEEVLDLFGVVVVGLAADALDLADLTGAGGGLDVLEVHLGVGGEVDDGAEVVVEALERLEGLEHLDELDGAEEVRVLCGDLDDHLEVLADVDLEHLAQALERLFHGELAKVGDEPVWLEEVGVYDDALDVCVVLVVLEGALEEAGLLAEVGDAGTIVVGEHVVAEDGVGDLRSVDEVHLEQARLEVGLFGLVVLERVEEEAGGLLDHVLAHEDVGDALDVDERAGVVGDEAGGELGALLGVGADDVLEEGCVVGGVADLLGVEDDLVKLAGLGKAGDDLVGDVGAEVDAERARFMSCWRTMSPSSSLHSILDSLSHFSRRCFLPWLRTGRASSRDSNLLSEPFSRRMPKYWRMGGEGAWLVGDLLELLDGLGGAKDAAGRVGGDLCGLAVLAGGEERVELLEVEVVCAGEVAAGGELEGEVGVVEGAEDVGDDGVFVNRDGEDLTLAVDADDAAGGFVLCGDKDGVAGDAVHVDAGAGLEVVEVDEAVLCDEVDDAVALADLHCDGEVVGGLWREEDVDGLLCEGGLAVLVVDLDDVELCAGGGAVGKGEQLEGVGCGVGLELGKGGCVALDGLGDAAFARSRAAWIPLRGRLDDLGALQADVAVKHLGGRGVALDGPVEYGGFGDEAEGGVVDPLPEGDVVVHEMRLDLCLCLDVEDLELPRGLECDDLLDGVHDGRVGGDGSAHDIADVVEVDDDDRVGAVDALADADEVFGFEGYVCERDAVGSDADVCELHMLGEVDWLVGHGDRGGGGGWDARR
ncbi:hypothetical protein L1887_57805 [Cichorium endivia]|nr:hypothetical protein L1887_57805 [Cichorium endivia]